MLLLLWHLQPMAAGHELDWNDRVTASQSSALDWNDRATASQSRALDWNDRTVVADSLSLDWNVLATVSLTVLKSLQARWGVYRPAVALTFGTDISSLSVALGVLGPEASGPDDLRGLDLQDGTSLREDRQTTDVQDGNMDLTERGVKEGQT